MKNLTFKFLTDGPIPYAEQLFGWEENKKLLYEHLKDPSFDVFDPKNDRYDDLQTVINKFFSTKIFSYFKREEAIIIIQKTMRLKLITLFLNKENEKKFDFEIEKEKLQKIGQVLIKEIKEYILKVRLIRSERKENPLLLEKMYYILGTMAGFLILIYFNLFVANLPSKKDRTFENICINGIICAVLFYLVIFGFYHFKKNQK